MIPICRNMSYNESSGERVARLPDPLSPRNSIGQKKGMRELNICKILFKGMLTAMLVVTFFALSALALVMSPFYLALIYRGKAKASTIVQIIPLGIIVALVWKIWKTEGMSETERAYYDGIIEGQIKASRLVGRMEGARMIAVPEDLSIKPVYSVRQIARENRDKIPF